MNNTDNDNNLYSILGVARDSSKNDIKQAFKKLALKFHPDKNPNGEAQFKQINYAYHTLINEIEYAEAIANARAEEARAEAARAEAARRQQEEACRQREEARLKAELKQQKQAEADKRSQTIAEAEFQQREKVRLEEQIKKEIQTNTEILGLAKININYLMKYLMFSYNTFNNFNDLDRFIKSHIETRYEQINNYIKFAKNIAEEAKRNNQDQNLIKQWELSAKQNEDFLHEIDFTIEILKYKKQIQDTIQELKQTTDIQKQDFYYYALIEKLFNMLTYLRQEKASLAKKNKLDPSQWLEEKSKWIEENITEAEQTQKEAEKFFYQDPRTITITDHNKVARLVTLIQTPPSQSKPHTTKRIHTVTLMNTIEKTLLDQIDKIPPPKYIFSLLTAILKTNNKLQSFYNKGRTFISNSLNQVVKTSSLLRLNRRK